jgi:predicted P-loop ATPase
MQRDRLLRFNIKALKRDRDQLWAEAAAREAEGESIRLDPALWSDAEREQEKRLARDPWQDLLEQKLARYEQEGGLKITATDLLKALDVDAAQARQDMSTRLTHVMQRLGWKRPRNRLIMVDGVRVAGYVKGEPPRRRIVTYSDRYGTTTELE